MYNDIVIVAFCMFAIYGIYSLFRELFILISRKYRIVAAVRIDCQDERFSDALIAADFYVSTHSFLERKPVLLCEGDVPKDFYQYGYEVYIKHSEE